MILELWLLLVATALGIIHLTAASFSYKAQVGNSYTIGARDKHIEPVNIAGRFHRAQSNFNETYAYFAVVTLIVFLTESSGVYSYWGALIYVTGRIVYLPLYGLGVRWFRTIAWNFSTLGLVMVGIQIVASN